MTLVLVVKDLVLKALSLKIEDKKVTGRYYTKPPRMEYVNKVLEVKPQRYETGMRAGLGSCLAQRCLKVNGMETQF